MANNFYGSICLSDIPRELIKAAKNGKKYLSISVGERRQPDAYGNTHYIKVYVRRDQKVAEGTNLFIGELKPSTPLAQPQAPAQPQGYTMIAGASSYPSNVPTPMVDNQDNLPF